MTSYRKKPLIVEAFQNGVDERPEWIDDAIVDGKVRGVGVTLSVTTTEGIKIAEKGDWVIQDHEGNIFIMTSEDFFKIYEKVKS